LGPLLYIFYTNDLSDTLNLVKSILFVDDTTLYYSSPHIPNLYEIMNKELDSLTDWFRANKLSLNVSKTNYMIFSNINSKQHAMEIKLTNTTITKKNCVKFLGVFIDENLNWNEHIKVIKQKISRSFFAINRAKHVLNKKHLVTLYYSLVYPYLTYGITLWGANYGTHLTKLVMIQKKIIRVIAGASYYAHTEPIFKYLRVLKLTDIYKIQGLKYVLNFLHNVLPSSLSNLFTLSRTVHEHSTHHCTSLKLQTLPSRTVVTSQCIANVWTTYIESFIFRTLYKSEGPRFGSTATD